MEGKKKNMIKTNQAEAKKSTMFIKEQQKHHVQAKSTMSIRRIMLINKMLGNKCQELGEGGEHLGEVDRQGEKEDQGGFITGLVERMMMVVMFRHQVHQGIHLLLASMSL
ncbi:hypothetical protein IFM89_037817 [Coptis chinensis]|uniref:Uncharacterized protein n=1 Tax=Coptis chinensis TaxID=261450 RepID=A0A835HB27_9MAGN|nr:hypothetical protein IFM89_037817 [Coptis chinensis]